MVAINSNNSSINSMMKLIEKLRKKKEIPSTHTMIDHLLDATWPP